MTVNELISELSQKCSSGLTVRVCIDGEYYSLKNVEVEYKKTVIEDKTSSEVFATIKTYSNKITNDDEDPWFGDYKPYSSDRK